MEYNSVNETQKFRQVWIWILLIIVFVVSILKGFSERTVSQADLIAETIFIILIPMLVILLFFFLRLETTIDQEGIQYRFFPLHIKKHNIEWKDVDKVFLRKYRPLMEFGGWGIRFGLRGGKAYNVSGTTGLQLVLKNGKKILFGTQKEKEIELYINNLKNKGIVK